MYFHASQTVGIKTLEPRISNHGIPLVYFSTKRENTLVYLSNAVEKYCRETGFAYDGNWEKWATYGFNEEGILVLEEYYPNAVYETYKGVSGYIYEALEVPGGQTQTDIPNAVITSERVNVSNCVFVDDAYREILKAASTRKIIFKKYAENNLQKIEWIKEVVKKEYETALEHPEYKHFLREHFSFLK